MRLRTHWFIFSRRVHNRWLNLRGRLSGYCMASTWREDTGHGPGYSPGYDHWRCWRKRGHTEAHRFNNYIWDDHGDGGAFDPLPVRNADNTDWFDGRGHGAPPRWGKHHAVAPRGRSRRMARYAQAQVKIRRAARGASS